MIQDLSKKNKWLPAVTFMLLVLAVFLNLGIYPLYLEEPRRALIALEMLFNDNLWVPTEFGEYYYKKPPLFNWVIIAGYKAFGNYSEFAVRFFSVISYLLMGVFCFAAGRKYVNHTFGVYAALLFYVCSDLIFYFTVTSGEIDLFYSFITYLGFLSVFYFYEKGNYWLLFCMSYFLAAVGTLTKGLPSGVFQGISILTVFIFHKNFKGLFRWSHLAGISIYLLLIGGYVWIYSQYNDPINYLMAKDSIVSQSMERTPMENGFFKVLFHLFLFPLELLKILAPGSVLLILFFSKRSRNAIKENKYIFFCFVLFLANIWVYWISPGSASRYLYMMFPLAITFILYPLFQDQNHRLIRIIEIIFFSVILIFCVTSFSLPFISRLEKINMLWLIAIGFGLVFGFFSFCYFKWKTWRLLIMIASFIFMRILFDLIILPIRASEDRPYEEKVIAEEIVDVVGDKNTSIYKGSSFSRTTIFYIEQQTGKVLSIDSVTTSDHYYIADYDLIPENKKFNSAYDFEYKGSKLGLIQFLDD